MNINVSNSLDKAVVFEQIAGALECEKLAVMTKDLTRPWGGFFVLDEGQAGEFARRYFPEIQMSEIQITKKLSPKILVVAPSKRLSWQFHHRRAEIWKVVAGHVGVVTSNSDEEGLMQELGPGNFIRLDKGERHRLVGLDSWGVIAEIWQHTDVDNPSDEEDIVRLQDDFGR